MTAPLIYEFKYGPKDWRRDVGETWGQLSNESTSYVVVDGFIVQSSTTRTEWEDPIAGVPATPQGPPYFYADGTYREDAVFRFLATHQITSTYKATGPDSYVVHISDYNILTGKTTEKDVTINGTLPVAETIGTALSNLTQQPIVATLYDPCDFVDSKDAYMVEFAESEEDLNAVGKRRMQRATAIPRRVTLAANPMIKIGDWVRVICSSRALDGLHIVVGRTIVIDSTGSATMSLDLEFWTR